MPSLVIPESGLSLRGSRPSSEPASAAVPNVFALSLADGVIEEMVKCVQNGKPIQLSLGDHPSILYGSKVQHLSTSHSSFTHELYRSSTATHSCNSSISNSLDTMSPPLKANPRKGVIKVENTYNTTFQAFFNPRGLFPVKKPVPSSAAKPTSVSNQNVASATAGTDAALAALQNSLATENAKKQENTTKFVKDGVGLPLPGSRRGATGKITNKAKFLSQQARASDTTRSMPSSPGLTGVISPSLGPTSVPLSQQQAEQAKAARKPMVHLLALNPMTEEALRDQIPTASPENFDQALHKVGDKNELTGMWELRRPFYKELDVWSFHYDTAELRQQAIDNAIKAFDKMRLGVSDPEWDKLLPKAERGTGKCLSKLQVQIARGVARPPKINVQKSEGSGGDTPAEEEGDDLFGEKPLAKVKGESMARSVSQPPTTKNKKVGEKEAQGKRLLSKNPTKQASKPTPTKKEKQNRKAQTRVLSSQFVEDSDEEEDSYLVPPKPAPKPKAKRSREEEAETSDSSIPLSKKVKKDNPPHRISDASQSSRTTTTSTSSSGSSKTKGTSPQNHPRSPLPHQPMPPNSTTTRVTPPPPHHQPTNPISATRSPGRPFGSATRSHPVSHRPDLPLVVDI